MTWASGGFAIAAAALGVYLGLTGDAILNDSDAQLGLVAAVTVLAAIFLIAPWGNARIRAVGLAVCAVAYHSVLAGSWVPWIEHYNAHAALGTTFDVWHEAVALPLLAVAGVLLVAAALFAWPASRSSEAVRLS